MVDSKEKGTRAELAVRDALRQATGLQFERTPLSGALDARYGLKSDLFIPNKTVFYCKSDWSNLDDVIIESIQKSNIEDRLFVFEKQIEQSSIGYIKNKFLSAL